MNLMNEHAIQMHKVNGKIIDFFRCKLQTELALADAHDDLMRKKCNWIRKEKSGTISITNWKLWRGKRVEKCVDECEN